MNGSRVGVRRNKLLRGKPQGGNTSNVSYSETFIDEDTIWPEGWGLPAELIFED